MVVASRLTLIAAGFRMIAAVVMTVAPRGMRTASWSLAVAAPLEYRVPACADRVANRRGRVRTPARPVSAVVSWSRSLEAARRHVGAESQALATAKHFRVV